MSSVLPTDYQTFIALSRYARWLEEDNRRETWSESVERYVSFIVKTLKVKHNYTVASELITRLTDHITTLKTMGSMRALMTAGPALERCNVAGYNCAYMPVDSLRAFDETMYILMCGTGVGFSVERNFVDKLPIVNESFEPTSTIITVDDSKMGWAKALREYVASLYIGVVPSVSYKLLRPAGARLKTFGGRASGPEPLEELFNFIKTLIKKSAGRRLTSLECHDIMCKIGEVVVVGGVRRSALISLSNLDDDKMRHAKTGEWWTTTAHRALANNSTAYDSKPDMGSFMREWLALYDSKSGERGIVNRQAMKAQVAKNGRRSLEQHGKPIPFGVNPCGEIILRPNQFCNLSEIIVRSTDTRKQLRDKVEVATILGTFQSCLTDFKYLRKIWKTNTEEERLLGVSLTGIMDHPVLNGTMTTGLELQDLLTELKNVAIETNATFATALGIPASAAITCVKPSGTVSQLVDSASGIHTRHSPYYVRTVRGDAKDPITVFMQDVGIPNEPDFTKPDSTVVFSFPIKSPEGSLCRTDMTAIAQLSIWLTYKRYWCEHNPSITVSVKEDEWAKVGAFVYEHFDELSGVSFLPFSDHTYVQAPYQDCSKEEYEQLLKRMPKNINWAALSEYETEDGTTGSQELACSGGVCEIVDIGNH